MEGKVTPARLLRRIVQSASGIRFDDMSREERFCFDVLENLGLAYMSVVQPGKCMARQRYEYKWKRGRAA